MARQPRKISPTGIHHVIWRGTDRQQIFFDDADSIAFLTMCASNLGEGFIILAYCLMGNHIHLLVKTQKDSIEALENAMKRLGVQYARYFNVKYTRCGSVFQGRYKSIPVQTRGYFLRVLRYIHQNPVEAGLCKFLAEYPWSSYQDYFGHRELEICPVQTKYALELLDSDTLKAFHQKKEVNAATLEGEAVRLTDEEVVNICASIAGCPVFGVANLPKEKKAVILRRLICEEGGHVPQLARLTGISRGEITRLVL